MRIAYRGNFSRTWCTEVHVAAALEELGHEVIRLQENETAWARCVEAARQAHMFLWTRTWQIDNEGGHVALAEMHAEGVPTVSFHLDRYVGLDREAQIPDDPFWRTSLVFTADGGHEAELAAYGVNHRWLPPAVHGAECGIGKPNRRFRHRVIFVGSNPYPHAEWRPYRDAVISTLKNHFGADFAVWPQGRPVRGQELADLYASCEVAVGDSCLSGGATRYWSDRIPETLGRGAALVHPEVEGLDEWYQNDEHLLTYPLGDFDGLVSRVEWLLRETVARQGMATRGQELVLGRDTYRHRMESVLAAVAELGNHEPEIPVVREMVMARTHYYRRGAQFRVRPGHPTDREVIEEVWTQGQYGVLPEDVRGKVVVDVGANIGAFSVLAAALGAREVHAFEPEPGNAALLRENTAGMAVVQIHEYAIGASAGAAHLEPGPAATHGGGTHLAGWKFEADDGTVLVQVLHPEEAFPGKIDLLKIDCEGSEYGIIDALDLTRLGEIRMEFHGPHMPHLAELDADGHHLDRWKAMVAKLADHGETTIKGHPTVGGLIRWRRF